MKSLTQAEPKYALVPSDAAFPKLSYTIDQAVEASGIGRRAMFEAMKDGKLVARKFGARNIILASDLVKFLESLPVREVA